MIYYFSGTGNSEWVARELAQKIGDKAEAITATDPSTVKIASGGCIGLIFPVYAWDVPRPMREFAEKLTVEVGCYTFAVCTCGSEAGKAIKKLNNILELDSGYSVEMPSNYMIGGIDTPEEIAAKLGAAPARVDGIAADILQRKRGFDVNEGGAAALKSSLVSALFQKFATNPKNFSVSQSCNGCGVCERICPLKNISIRDGKPVWGNNCVQCLGCLNRCPQTAIEYGNTTAGKARYFCQL